MSSPAGWVRRADLDHDGYEVWEMPDGRQYIALPGVVEKLAALPPERWHEAHKAARYTAS